jgi:hypothetical protein
MTLHLEDRTETHGLSFSEPTQVYKKANAAEAKIRATD